MEDRFETQLQDLKSRIEDVDNTADSAQRDVNRVQETLDTEIACCKREVEKYVYPLVWGQGSRLTDVEEVSGNNKWKISNHQDEIDQMRTQINRLIQRVRDLTNEVAELKKPTSEA